MNMIKALETGLPYRPKGYEGWYTYSPNCLLTSTDPTFASQPTVSKEILLGEWEVKYPEVTINRDKWSEAVGAALKKLNNGAGPATGGYTSLEVGELLKYIRINLGVD
jgi:hypothetical protein